MLDGIDDRLAHGHAHPVERVLLETNELAGFFADDLDKIQHVEVTAKFEPDDAVSVHAVGGVHPIPVPPQRTGPL